MKQAQWKFGGIEARFGAGGTQGGQNGGLQGEDATVVTEVSYSDEVVAELIYMIEEEKLAGDVYEAFYDMYGLKIFDNIATSEDRHFDALIAQAETMGIDTDQFVFNEPGVFEDPELQALYDEMRAFREACGEAHVKAILATGP